MQLQAFSSRCSSSSAVRSCSARPQHLSQQHQRRQQRVVAAASPSSSRQPFSQHPQQQQHQQHQLLQHMQHHHQQQQQQRARRRGSACITAAAAPSMASVDVEELVGPNALEADVFEIVTYALKLAWTAETYYVHSWMLLLGLLKKEDSVACQVLRDLGLEDIYGSWNEVLWALNVADGLTPRAFAPRMTWGERASLILQGAVRYGGWAGRGRVSSVDLLMAFAASDVLESLFPDLDLSFDRVRRAVEKASGAKYVIPGLDDGKDGGALTSQDNFL